MKKVLSLFTVLVMLTAASGDAAMKPIFAKHARPRRLGAAGIANDQVRATSTQSPAQTLRDSADGFEVTFEGIILHALFKSPETGEPMRRAIVVQPNYIKMRHAPLLVVSDDVDVPSLRDASGQRVYCNAEAKRCWVTMVGLDMRIVEQGVAAEDGRSLPDDTDESFTCLLPHLGTDPNIRASLLSTLTTADPPHGPAAAYFELDRGGVLLACPFDGDDPSKNGGRFIPAGATPRDPCREGDDCQAFAEVLYWINDEIKAPSLELWSPRTGRWLPVRFQTTHPLFVTVSNQPAHKMSPSPEHFVLFQKLLRETKLPTIQLGPATPCATCDESGGEVFVAGCSDSQWP